jgi:hypothetical protein
MDVILGGVFDETDIARLHGHFVKMGSLVNTNVTGVITPTIIPAMTKRQLAHRQAVYAAKSPNTMTSTILDRGYHLCLGR